MRPKVYLIPADRPTRFRWKDHDGKIKQRVCHAANLRAARRQARDIEEELAAQWGLSGDVSWLEFEDRYLDQALGQRRRRTGDKWSGVNRKWHAFPASKGRDPATLAMREVTFPMLLEFEAWIAPSLAPTTVVTSIKAFRAGLDFAARNGWMPMLPRGANVKEPARTLPDPITQEEFERLIAATRRVLVKRLRPHWQAILKAYSHGGLRLSEPLDFRWRDPRFHVPVLDDCDFPYVDYAPRQKNRKHQSVAITPEFADLIRELPMTNDYVFQVNGPKVRYKGVRMICETIRAISEQAKLTRPTDRGDVYVTAQHLRRSFGQRMSKRVGAATLRHLMRHSSIATTMKYYVADDARMAAMDLTREVL